MNLHNSLTVLLFGVFWDYARKVVVEIHKAYFRLGMHSLYRDTYNQLSDRHCWEWHQLSLFPGRSLVKIKAMKMFKIRQGPTLGVSLIENSDDQRRMGKAYTLSKWVPTYHVVNQAISFSFYQQLFDGFRTWTMFTRHNNYHSLLPTGSSPSGTST